MVDDLRPRYLQAQFSADVLFIGKALMLSRTSKTTPNTESLPLALEQGVRVRLMEINTDVEFNITAFEATIADLRCRVSEGLVRLLHDQANVIGVLQAFKDYYLVSIGECPVFSSPLNSLLTHSKVSSSWVSLMWVPQPLPASPASLPRWTCKGRSRARPP